MDTKDNLGVFDLGKAISDFATGVGKTAVDVSGKVIDAVGKAATDVSTRASDIAEKTREMVVAAIDVNGDGCVDIQDIIIMGLRVPGIRIDRGNFLRSELQKRISQEDIDKAIACNPARAGISLKTIDRIADDVIAFERNCVSGISAALGMPGGFALAATIPADIAQYYGYMLRAAQKLMYLYGFPQIDTDEKGQTFDSETINILIICLGTMYGAAGASNAIRAMAKALATGVENKMLRAALTKGTIYPIVKNIASWFGKHMTKQVFAGFFKKAIPVIGGVVGGAITFLSFKPCCDKLKASLQDTMLSNPARDESEEDNVVIIDGL